MTHHAPRLLAGAGARLASGALLALLASCVSGDGDPAPEELATAAQEVCTGTTCGAQLASLDGVPAYSNGSFMGSSTSCNNDYYWGGRYQCVEYARRYLCEKHRYGTDPTNCYMMPSLVLALGDGRACRICDLKDPHLEVHYPYDGYVPRHGDLYVESCKASNNNIGHVAVIDYISGSPNSWTLATVEQNRSCSGRANYAYSGARCFVRWK